MSDINIRRRTYGEIDGDLYINISMTDSNPDTRVIVAGDTGSYISKFRRCLVKYTSANNVSICYLNDRNSNYYHDGVTKADLTGAEGDVMVYFPEFWYKGDFSSSTHYYMFSGSEIDGWHHAPASLVGAYKANENNSKLHSWSGVSRQTSTTMSQFRTYATNRGTGFHIIDWQQHNIIGWMFMAKYKSTNGQSKCGTGPNRYEEIYNGTTNSLGMTDTTPETAPSYSGMLVNFLGIEGCWGYVEEWMEGAIGNGRSIGEGVIGEGVILFDKGWYRADTPMLVISSPTKRLIRSSNSGDLEGFIDEMVTNEYCDLFPSSIGGTTSAGGASSTYWCDYCGINPSGYYGSSYLIRSYTRSDAGGGPFYVRDGIDSGSRTLGSRLAFDGNITVVDSVSEFRSIANN